MQSQLAHGGLARAHFARRLAPSSRRLALSVSCNAAATVVFKCTHHVNFGESVHITGGDPALGNWNPQSSLSLNWSEGDVWTSEAEIPVGAKVEYKFIVKKKDAVEWQQGQNKCVTVPNSAKIEVLDAWSGNGQTKVTVLQDAVAELEPEPTPPLEDFVVAPPPVEAVAARYEVPAPTVHTISQADLSAKILEAELVAQSYDHDKSHFQGPVSTVENLAAEELVGLGGLTANNIVHGIPAGAVAVNSAQDAQTQYEEADKFEVLEVGAQKSNVAVAAKKVGPGALDHLSLSELRTELKKRGLPSSGNRRQLITKLQTAGAL